MLARTKTVTHSLSRNLYIALVSCSYVVTITHDKPVADAAWWGGVCGARAAAFVNTLWCLLFCGVGAMLSRKASYLSQSIFAVVAVAKPATTNQQKIGRPQRVVIVVIRWRLYGMRRQRRISKDSPGGDLEMHQKVYQEVLEKHEALHR